MTDPVDAAAARELADAATDGPWEAEHHYHRKTGRHVVSEVHPVAVCEGNGYGGVCSEADAALIAAARELVPAMADELDRLRAQVDRLRAEKRNPPQMVPVPNTVKINMDPPPPQMVPVPIRCRRCGYGGA